MVNTIKLKSYKDLIVWQKAMDLCEMVYAVTKEFPKHELFGLVSQIQRSAVSVPSNIAEGYSRFSPKEYGQFYTISYGSLLELETQLTLACRLGYITQKQLNPPQLLIEEIAKMLHVMILKTKQLSPKS